MRSNQFKTAVAAVIAIVLMAGLAGCSNGGDKVSSIGPDGKLAHLTPQPNPPNLRNIIQEDIKKNQSRIIAMREAANAEHGGGPVVLPPTQ